MRLEHHLVGGYVGYISPHIIIIIIKESDKDDHGCYSTDLSRLDNSCMAHY